ncbi:pyridoxamine 5'-phosphate oxidase family protein [Halobellus rubicundus]|uniref:Pyridoxamine 5'-phosphate oxidase family protein n=1 Tax=Halobellus rubicundus TaxID=2996466 RepID=A0ABD5MA87_9EURY
MATDFQPIQGARMDDSAIDRLLEERGYGVLSMADGERAYGIPLSFGYDGDDRLYFVFVGYSEQWKKMIYADESAAVSFLVLDVDADGGWRSAIVSGPFERISADEWDAAREAMADNAFRPELLTEVDIREHPQVWVLDAEEKTGRAVGTE